MSNEIKLVPPLTKDAIWNEMDKLYPEAMKEFCQFIDDYKQAVNWNALFGGFGKDAPKFHDLPFEMQAGIWLSFAYKNQSSPSELYSHTIRDIKETLSNIEKKLS